MPWSMRNINCITILCALLLSSQPTAGTVIVPGEVAADETIARRACEPAAPDVSQSSIIAGVCNQTLANAFPTCSDQMTAQMQQSAANTCGQYFSLSTDCLMAIKNDHTACSDSLLGYQDCQVYTIQAYAYCACYYTLPASIADCANEQLQPQSRATATVQTTSAPVTAIPTNSDIPASAVPENKEPGTPPILAASQEATSPSPLTFFSDPRTPSAPNAAPSTTTTVVSTYTTTFTDTTTATIISSAVISTAYTCSAGDATIPAPTPIDAASIGPEIVAPDPAIVPTAQSTGTDIPEGTGSQDTSTSTPPTSSPSEPSQPQNTALRIAEGQIASLETSTSISPSTSTSISTPVFSPTFTSASVSAPILASLPAPIATIIPSAATAAARNGSAVCVVCRRGRRSRVF